MKQVEQVFTLANGVRIPSVGFGTWRIEEGEGCVQAVAAAIRHGYRHIDTAACYGNEVSVGKGIVASGISRDSVFVTSKLWNTENTYDRARKAFDATMTRLGLDVLDLYLLHWPAVAKNDANWIHTNHEKWRALEDLYLEGRIRAIGVSNFHVMHLEPLMAEARVVPMVNQLEIQPGFSQAELVKWCQARAILPQAWSPLARGRIFDFPVLQHWVKASGRTPAQICLRWCLQNGVQPLSKTTQEARMIENLDVFGFELSDEAMAALNTMPETEGHLNPETRDF